LQDLALLEQMGVNSYRFSIGVPRVIPTKGGAVNAAGLDYYDNLVDNLLDRDIAPVVTLYHWDLPQYLEDEGGWLNRDAAYRLADYTSAVVERLGDRVECWTTLNEPWCSAFLGYGSGEHAPGIGGGRLAFRAAHHLNLAHGLMTQAVRAQLGDDATCSITLNLHQLKGNPDAVHRMDLVGNRIWLDPIIRGGYPQELLDTTADICDWSFVREGDESIINQVPDVLGVNYYSTTTVDFSSARKGVSQSTGATNWPACSDIDILDVDGEKTAMGWLVDPDGLTDLLVRLKNDYPNMPLMVTENGAACEDSVVVENGEKRIHDAARVSYLERHFAACRAAMDAGVDLRGYFVWSLLDNFEWALGYSRRFGVTYVDYETQERIPKDSFAWYRDAIERDVLGGKA
jgi:beta-glucosidase